MSRHPHDNSAPTEGGPKARRVGLRVARGNQDAMGRPSEVVGLGSGGGKGARIGNTEDGGLEKREGVKMGY